MFEKHEAGRTFHLIESRLSRTARLSRLRLTNDTSQFLPRLDG